MSRNHRFLWPVSEGLRPAEFHEKLERPRLCPVEWVSRPAMPASVPASLGFFDPASVGRTGAPTVSVGPSAFFWPVELILGHYTRLAILPPARLTIRRRFGGGFAIGFGCGRRIALRGGIAAIPGGRFAIALGFGLGRFSVGPVFLG